MLCQYFGKQVIKGILQKVSYKYEVQIRIHMQTRNRQNDDCHRNVLANGVDWGECSTHPFHEFFFQNVFLKRLFDMVLQNSQAGCWIKHVESVPMHSGSRLNFCVSLVTQLATLENRNSLSAFFTSFLSMLHLFPGWTTRFTFLNVVGEWTLDPTVDWSRSYSWHIAGPGPKSTTSRAWCFLGQLALFTKQRVHAEGFLQ